MKTTTTNNEKFYVQQTLGGWKQNAIFSGTEEECQEYFDTANLATQIGWAIIPERYYEVDYL